MRQIYLINGIGTILSFKKNEFIYKMFKTKDKILGQNLVKLLSFWRQTVIFDYEALPAKYKEIIYQNEPKDTGYLNFRAKYLSWVVDMKGGAKIWGTQAGF